MFNNKLDALLQIDILIGKLREEITYLQKIIVFVILQHLHQFYRNAGYNNVHRTTWCSTIEYTELRGVVQKCTQNRMVQCTTCTQNHMVQFNRVHRTNWCNTMEYTEPHVQYNRVHKTTWYSTIEYTEPQDSVLQSTHNHMVQYNRINRTTGFSVQHSTQKNMVGLEYTESHKLKYIQRTIKMYSKLQYNANRG